MNADLIARLRKAADDLPMPVQAWQLREAAEALERSEQNERAADANYGRVLAALERLTHKSEHTETIETVADPGNPNYERWLAAQRTSLDDEGMLLLRKARTFVPRDLELDAAIDAYLAKHSKAA